MRIPRSRSARPRAPRILRDTLVTAGAALALAVVATLAAPRAHADAGAYVLVVHPSNPAREADRSFVAQAFLKKATHWPSGVPIQPVDLDQKSPVRQRWSNEVLNRTVDAVKAYWQQMIFSGRSLPPPEVVNDEQVIDFVIHRVGSIGYVSAAANLHGAHALTLHQ